LVSDLKELRNEVVEVASEEAASAITEQLMKLNLVCEKAQKQTERYANDAKNYVDKIIAQTLTTIVKKTAETIENKLAISNEEINKRKSKYKPDRWLAIAFFSCLFLVGGGYYLGLNNNEHMSDYRAAKSNEAKWAGFVRQWQKATDQEKKTIEKMMKR
jgi:hypothetical protein